MPTTETKKQRRGFAAMSAERQREIARMGGRAAHEKGTAHEFTAEEAQAAGRKGGLAVSRDRDHMVTIGRRRGMSSQKKRRRSENPNSQAKPTNKAK